MSNQQPLMHIVNLNVNQIDVKVVADKSEIERIQKLSNKIIDEVKQTHTLSIRAIEEKWMQNLKVILLRDLVLENVPFLKKLDIDLSVDVNEIYKVFPIFNEHLSSIRIIHLNNFFELCDYPQTDKVHLLSIYSDACYFYEADPKGR